jgi:hypothetical protein
MKTRLPHVLIHPISGNFFAWIIAFLFFSLTKYFNGSYAWIDGYGPMATGLLIAGFWSTRIHAFREAVRIEDFKHSINHSKRFFQRTCVALTLGWSIHILAEGWVFGAYVRGLTCAFYLGAIFWLNFDFILNNDRGKALFYVSEWYKTAWIDRFFKKFGSPVLWLISKIVLFYVALMLYMASFSWEL